MEAPEPVTVDAEDDAARDAWASRITPHALRHTAASLAISRGLTVMQVQRMLGHARPSITLDTYSDLFDADAVGGAMKLNAAHKAWVESTRSHAEEREAFKREAASARSDARDNPIQNAGF